MGLSMTDDTNDHDEFADQWDPTADEGQSADPLDDLAQASQESQGHPQWADPRLALDDQGRLACDVVCRACGYNLRGQAVSGSCPECGLEVETSARGDRLAFSDPDWLAKLSKGMKFQIVAIFLGIALSCVGAGVGMAFAPQNQFSQSMQQAQQQQQQQQQNQFSGGSTQPPMPSFSQQMSQGQSTPQILVTIVTTLIYGSVMLYGIWLTTTQENPGGADSAGTSRQLWRWGAIVGMGFGLLGNVVSLVSPMVSLGPSFISAIVGLIGWFAMFIYLKSLALRIPDKNLARNTSTVMWGIVSCYGIMIVGGIIAAIIFITVGVSGGSGSGAMIGGMLVILGGACLLGVGLLGLAIWWIVLMFFYRGHFERASEVARRSGIQPDNPQW